MQRYSFLKDNDGHLYLVPVELKQEFNNLLKKAEKNDDHDEFNDKFEKCRCGSHLSTYTFTNPTEE